MHVSAFGETRPQPYQDVVVERSYLTGFRFLPAMRSPHEPSPAELSQLLASLVAFLGGHRYCGELDSGAEDEWIWMTCTCGAVIRRTAEPAHRQ